MLLAVTLAAAACQGGDLPQQQQPVAVFEWFEYRGNDAVFDEPLSAGEYRNPVVAGFFPDPSIVRRGDDWYMVHSSFAWAPSVPILHSRNLTDWRLIGHALTRPEQLELRHQGVSRGIFAPTIRYNDGTFYVITTAVDTRGNFIVTADDPAGPWSDPILLPEIDGIDPDLFFDHDGRAWIAHNGPPPGEPLYDGHRAIWLWQYDLERRRVVAASGRVIVNGGVDLSTQPIWIEAPHIYRIGGWYYLLCAEGGTGYNHSEVVFRTRSLDEPFEPWDENPILTQRDLDIDRPDPVTTAGHADITPGPDGNWWAVFLATRAYDGTHYNTGRETFLLPVSWRDEWPVILERGKPIPYRAPGPQPRAAPPDATPLTGNFSWRDDFDTPQMDLHWNLLRGFDRDWFTTGDGTLRMHAKAVSLATLEQPAFLARRQQHLRYDAALALRLPAQHGYSAGIAVHQNETHHYYFGARRTGDRYELFVEQAAGAEPAIIVRMHYDDDAGSTLVLKIRGDRGNISFAYQPGNGDERTVAQELDGRILSTGIAGGFVGTMLGPHARFEQP